MLNNFDAYCNSILIENKEPLYGYVGNCVEMEDAMEVLRIVEQDDLEYPEETFYHNPKLQISPRSFYELTGKEPNENNFYGFNKDLNIVFEYNPDKDIHYFYSK
jgi:hypothetical protein